MGGWTRSQLKIGDKMLIGIDTVMLTSNCDVKISDSSGATYTYYIKEIPQGFLDAWGVTGDAIDKAIVARDLKARARAEAAEEKDAADRKAAIDVSATKLEVRITQVVNESEIIGTINEGYITVHVGGIDTSDMTDDQTIVCRVWPESPYRYVTVMGATAQIKSFTTKVPAYIANGEYVPPPPATAPAPDPNAGVGSINDDVLGK
jgi:hypothetical protein